MSSGNGLNAFVAALGKLGVKNDKTTILGLLRDILTIVKGFRNGLVYGAKIRLPHALVMTFLFRTEPYTRNMNDSVQDFDDDELCVDFLKKSKP